MTTRLICALLLPILIAGCATPTWHGHPRPTAHAVELALSNSDAKAQMWDLDVNSLPEFDVPQKVRPCCAFGNEQKVEIGFVPIPLFRLGNSVSFSEIGPHRFDAGSFPNTVKGASANGLSGGENNGIIYTLRGGFIDLAHVRDTADDTVALFFIIIHHLGQPHIIELPSEIGPRYIQMKAFDTSGLSAKQRWYLAAELAARLAYFKAESHEIAQWHGYTSFAGWPEEVSGYSPEDLYSNMLGAKLSLALIHSKLVLNDQLYNQSMTVWLSEFIQWLEPVSKQQTNAMFSIVDGYWWDSCKPIPDKFMVLMRHFRMGDEQHPYRVSESLARSNSEWPAVSELYKYMPSAHTLSLPGQLYGFQLDQLATLNIDVSQAFQQRFTHIPDVLWRSGFDQSRFGEIALWDHKEDEKQLAALSNSEQCVQIEQKPDKTLIIHPRRKP
ncbi:Uncharacterised protein [BD1-7 clade bacterium]|uniref:DUF4056 domain-containing protein n=1 Tax=BD1-7 clade bacterium TaxID=2029982 RepID=A0A5S9QT61_9GAMM|nr:Uncharacterised protein [BD1-7 clade bacterium]CAA0122519.1 Uncharacterised protein [BD1-7 clade bacterium]